MVSMHLYFDGSTKISHNHVVISVAFFVHDCYVHKYNFKQNKINIFIIIDNLLK